MKKLASLIALAFVATSFTFVAQPAPAQAAYYMGHGRCPRGTRWVPPHRDRMGHWIPGHCRRF